MTHHAIIVTNHGDRTSAARTKAVEIFAARGLGHLVSGVIPSGLNDFSSFFVAPDGSGEQFQTSADGDACRQELIDWLSDGESSRWPDWIEIAYGTSRNRITRDDRSEGPVF